MIAGSLRLALPILALGIAAACNGAAGQRSDMVQAFATATPIAVTAQQAPLSMPDPEPDHTPRPALSPTPAGPSTFLYSGALTQGGWIRGQAPAGTKTARLGDQALALDADGAFFAAFDRDAGANAILTAELANGQTESSSISIAPRAWKIERVNIARRPGGASAAFLKRRRPELAAIGSARAQRTGAQGWRQRFVWPAKGRISGRFGSQRIYRGEPGSYHSGLDIATGRSGSPFVAPADGVVVLAADNFSLEGKLLIIDHGQGLNSAFLHASRLRVLEGERVQRGQHIGDIGSSGRATGPHLHWSIKWHDARLDPLLFLDRAN